MYKCDHCDISGIGVHECNCLEKRTAARGEVLTLTEWLESKGYIASVERIEQYEREVRHV